LTDFPTHCDKCNTKWLWDKNAPTPLEGQSKRKYGWWKEDYTKIIHDKARCQEVFKALPYNEQVLIEANLQKKKQEYKASLTSPVPATLNTLQPTTANLPLQNIQNPLKIQNVGVGEFQYGWLKSEEIEEIDIITNELKEVLHVVELNMGTNSPPARTGMVFNKVCDRLLNKKNDEIR